jgi:hypothetical protein
MSSRADLAWSPPPCSIARELRPPWHLAGNGAADFLFISGWSFGTRRRTDACHRSVGLNVRRAEVDRLQLPGATEPTSTCDSSQSISDPSAVIGTIPGLLGLPWTTRIRCAIATPLGVVQPAEAASRRVRLLFRCWRATDRFWCLADIFLGCARRSWQAWRARQQSGA